MKPKKKILVMEDEKNILQAIASTLKAEGFTIFEANDGAKGLAIALAEHPDLILIDVLMPIMDGMIAFKKIREDKWGASVPIIILTNVNATEENFVKDVITLKPLLYLVKSEWKIHDVAEKIKKIFA